MPDPQELLTTDPTPLVAKTLTQGGAAVAVGSWGASAVDWMNANSGFVLSAVAIFGAVVSAIGLGLQWYLGYRKLQAYRQHLEEQRNGAS